MIKHTQGFIAISTVLILSAIFLSISLSMSLRAISGTGTSIAFNERESARYLALACLQYARMELLRTLDYEGNEGILVGEQTCEILDIEGTGNTDRTLRVEATVGKHTFRITDEIAEISPEMKITSSKRVISF